MARFIDWYNETENSLPAITRAGLAHLYFVSIHPFEDGNGRVGRAVALKTLLQKADRQKTSLRASRSPILFALSPTILAHHKLYYAALEAANKSLEVTDWLVWFAKIVLEAQQWTRAHMELIAEKSRLMDRLSDQINAR